MKRCEKAKTANVPGFFQGETYQNFAGNVYMAAQINSAGALRLISLDDGNRWSTDDLWGSTSPSDWKKVTCCYTVEE